MNTTTWQSCEPCWCILSRRTQLSLMVLKSDWHLNTSSIIRASSEVVVMLSSPLDYPLWPPLQYVAFSLLPRRFCHGHRALLDVLCSSINNFPVPISINLSDCHTYAFHCCINIKFISTPWGRRPSAGGTLDTDTLLLVGKHFQSCSCRSWDSTA